MPVYITFEGETMTAKIVGDIDHHSAKELREDIDAALFDHKPKVLYLDYRDVAFMDSSGIGLIMGRYKQMQLLDGELRVVNVSAQLKKVMRVAGLDRLAVIENGNKRG
ncbi:MAG: anti-sigma factor antagonist [Acetanaerobacterium sp.]